MPQQQYKNCLLIGPELDPHLTINIITQVDHKDTLSIIIKPRSPAITLLEHDLTRLNGLTILGIRTLKLALKTNLESGTRFAEV